MKGIILVTLGVLSVATLCSTPLAHAADGGGISSGEFKRYQNQQELELEREQALDADLSAPQSLEETRIQRRRFEYERIWQRQLLERQRRWVGAERAKSRRMPRSESSRGLTLQRLRREQASERLGRELLR